jgi:hypothetical protein
MKKIFTYPSTIVTTVASALGSDHTRPKYKPTNNRTSHLCYILLSWQTAQPAKQIHKYSQHVERLSFSELRKV